jgi:hypothetical protein
MDRFNRHQTDLRRLCRDIETAAEITGVSYNKDVVQSVLDAYGLFYSEAPVAFTTSTRPRQERGLSVRYVDFQVPHDPYEIALKHGLIREEAHPIYNLLPEIRSKMPLLGYGVDLDVSYGLTKIWSFVIPESTEEALQLYHLPPGVKDHAAYFDKHRLTVFSFLALDFREKSANIYFTRRPGEPLETTRIIEMIEDLELPVPDEEVLAHCTRAATIYFTFNWQSPRVQRLCFSMSASDPSHVPGHLHPLLEAYANHAPILARQRKFIYSAVLSRGGEYIKIENDYTGSMIDLIIQDMESVIEPGEE